MGKSRSGEYASKTVHGFLVSVCGLLRFAHQELEWTDSHCWLGIAIDRIRDGKASGPVVSASLREDGWAQLVPVHGGSHGLAVGRLGCVLAAAAGAVFGRYGLRTGPDQGGGLLLLQVGMAGRGQVRPSCTSAATTGAMLR